MILDFLASQIRRGFGIQPRHIKRRTLVNHLSNVSWLTVVNRIGALSLLTVGVHYTLRMALGM